MAGFARMADIARATGLARSTVSRALRDHPSIPESTRLRVREAAKSLGYEVNPLVSQIMTRMRKNDHTASGEVIAYLNVLSREAPQQQAAFFRAAFRGAAERCEQLGYRLDTFHSTLAADALGRVREVLQARGIRGLLVSPLPQGTDTLDFDFTGFAAATIGQSLQTPYLHRASNHHARSSQIALNELAIRGYRKPGLVLTKDQDQRTDRAWSGNFLSNQVEMRKVNCVPILLMESICPVVFAKWYLRYRPDAVLSLLHEVVGWLEANGARVPQDCAFVTLDKNPQRPEGGVYQNPSHIGGNAVDMIVAQVLRNESGVPTFARTSMTEGVWVEGYSVAPPPALFPSASRGVSRRSL